MTQEKRLEEIFRKNENNGIAIAITGSWGVGKTHFWNTFRESYKLRNKYVYVSLFGLESLSDLKTNIYSNIENNHSSLEIPRWIRGLPSILKDTRISQFGISASAKVFDSLMFNQVKDAVICFDDFERISNKLDIKDVMGLANQLKLERNCQVILILDESKAEGENQKKYAEYKEKLIDETIKIRSVEPLLSDKAKNIQMDEPLIDLMVKFADVLEIHNFRFFQKVIKLYKQFREQLSEKVAYSTKEIILIRILQGYLIEDYGSSRDLEWSDFSTKYAIRLMDSKKENESETIKIKALRSLKDLSYTFFFDTDQWVIEFKKWFDQKGEPNFNELKLLVNSDLISESNQNLKKKIWDIFERRFNLKVVEADFTYLSTIGKQMISTETIYNTSVAYEFMQKYLEDKSKSKQFQMDVLNYIDQNIGEVISRKQQEKQMWSYDDNVFYEYIDKLANNYQQEKNLTEILSHFLEYDYFKNESDRNNLKEFTSDDWFKYLTKDIYTEKFYLENKKTVIACLRRLVKIQYEDGYELKKIIINVLEKIGKESDFKKRYINDIIKNHLD